MRSDTIVAPATPAGVSGLAVIRLSGPDTIPVLRRLVPKSDFKKQDASVLKPVWLKDKKGNLLDQVMIAAFFKPRSYTGEDMAEISCHGSPFIIDQIVELCQDYGCRIAEPGEFTRRAVKNGKLTLSQAEALGYLVFARTPAAHRHLIAAYQGETNRFISAIGEELRNLYSWCEYLLGFDEEEKLDECQLNRRTKKILLLINRTLTRAEHNRFLFEPARVTIIGRPNVGKSSLFNRLLQEDRAITSPIPGTTRDYLDATTTISGVPVRLIDTCGFDPKTSNPLTRLGTSKTEEVLNQSDLLLVMFDSSQPARTQDRAILALIKNSPKIFIINKIDLKRRLERDFLPTPVIPVSCKTGAGINQLRKAIAHQIHPARSGAPCPIITRRQIQALKTCYHHLSASLNRPDLETRGTEIRLALEALNEIDLPFTSEDVMNRIFKNFCVGK